VREEEEKEMPSIVVEIEWDIPDEQFWLNADSVALALHAYCRNTRFAVRQLHPTTPDDAGEADGVTFWGVQSDKD